ncbi:hypothetical protein B0A48_05005 [Cryoendolithus antarcticus]|uniref:Peptidase S53 domain-containing protein n=1 Tax=Cryoendolithus antarcticus TaxID=1507870 RepID=A0A1V8TE06_9PEZI|nr:hypothetical protein B0A48_05005 [Cryoendolithus antarcticus]
MHLYSCLAGCILATAYAAPGAVPGHVIHERKSEAQSSWKRAARVGPDAIIPVRIGLVQSNMDVGHDRLMSLSDPNSKQYGQHLSSEEIHDLFAPSKATVDAVKSWLASSGINNVVHSENKGWLAIDMPTKKAEKLFKTEYYEHSHASGALKIGCSEYHLPSHLRKHIDYVTPGVKLSAKLKKRNIEKRSGPGWGHPNPHWPGPWRQPPNHNPWNPPPGAPQLPQDLQGCNLNITPICIRALYGIPTAHLNDSVNAMGLYEGGDYYAQSDLNKFFAEYAPNVPQGTAPIQDLIDGAIAPVAADDPRNTGESDIDMDMAFSLIYPQNVVLYQVDDPPTAAAELAGKLFGFLNTFLDALDGSYCTYSAYGISGNSPGLDPTYPDPVAGGYNGSLQCGVYKPTRVISISYGQAEADLPSAYLKRQCNEFMKLGLQGHSVFVSSSDYGVASYPGDGSASGCLSAPGMNQTIYNPDDPSGCPYLTSVGGTQVEPDKTVKDPESAMQTALSGAPLFSSGGGFSNDFPRPWYQSAEVNQYFAQHDPGHPYYYANAAASNIGQNGGIYNRGGRGYPDVSANGANFRAYTNGTDYHYYGTSLASPLFASVITLINEERTAIGKGPVGFINPVLYAHPYVLNDIKNGSNPNCGSSGFSAVSGWDPVTGLGTPNYPALLKLFLSLP